MQALKDVLLLFSGGRDSILSAVRLIKNGYHVRMISFDNGHMQKTKLMRKTADRLVSKFGKECCSYEGIFSIAPILYDFLGEYMRESSIGCQMLHCTCLCCHTAMLLRAVIFCKENNIHYLASGDKEADPYLFNSTEFFQFYVSICRENGIELLRPVRDVSTNFERKIEIAESGIHPKVYEPQCWLGYSTINRLTHAETVKAYEIFSERVMCKVKKRIDDIGERGCGKGN